MSPDGGRTGGGTSGSPRPVREMADRHLTVLDEAAETFTFATFTDSKPEADPDPLARILHGGLGDHWAELCDLNAQRGCLRRGERHRRGRRQERECGAHPRALARGGSRRRAAAPGRAAPDR